MTDPITTVADFTRVLELDVQRHLGDADLTLTRYATLARADATTMLELAQRVGVSPQMVSRTVRDLRLLGYVQQSSGLDRRQRLLQVTDRGRAALARATAMNLPPALLAAMDAYVTAAATP